MAIYLSDEDIINNGIASQIPGPGLIPIANGNGKLDDGWISDSFEKTSNKGVAGGYAALDSSGKVIQNPANATSIPTANAIVMAGPNGKIADGWNIQSIAPSASPTFAGLTVDTNTLYIDNVNHRVGIGTTSPQRQLHVIDFFMVERVSEFGGCVDFRKSYTQNNNEDVYIQFTKQTAQGGSYTRYGYIQVGTGGFKIVPEQGVTLQLAPYGGNVSVGSCLIYTPTSAPSSPVEGMVYYDSSAHKLKVYTNSGWQTISSS
jgi:hypothetical protein